MSIDRERAEKATEYLVDSSRPIGAAKAAVVKAEAMLRHVKALAMRKTGETSAAAQEREAYASDLYVGAIDALFETTKLFETLKADREAAQAVIAFFQTLSANERGADKGMRTK